MDILFHVSVGLGQSLVFTSIPILARKMGLMMQVSMVLDFCICLVLLHLFGDAIGQVWNQNNCCNSALGYSANMMLIILPLYLFENGILSSAISFCTCCLRLIYGLFGSATDLHCLAMLAVFHAENRSVVFSNLESGFVLGTVLGPLIGAFMFGITNNELPFILLRFDWFSCCNPAKH